MFKNKTILYIVHNYNNFQKDPIEEISKHFKKVYVLVRYKPISKILKFLPFKSLKKYEDSYVVDLNNVPDNVEVIRVPVWYLPWGVFFKLAGYTHYKAVKRATKKHNIKFDLIHSHFTWTAGYVGMRLKEEYKKPLVLTVHENNDWFGQELNSGDQRLYDIWKSVDILFRVNKRTIKDLKEFNNNVVYLSNSFNEDLFFPKDKEECRRKLKLNSKDKILLNVGNVEEYKGQIHLIRAMDILINKYKYNNLKLYIIGEGSLRGTLENEIKELELESNVFLLGKQIHKDVPVWVNASDLFVLPSLAESFGIVQIEAFACGKPVVASKNEGSKEVIISEDHGLLCEVGDSEDLALKIDIALKKDWNEEKILEYVNKFKQEEVNKKLLKVYNKILDKRHNLLNKFYK